MSTTIVVPELGESILEATVGQWRKEEGDRVSVGEVVVELETDKVNLEVGAKEDGVLSKIERKQGDTVKIGDTLGTIGEKMTGEDASAKSDKKAGKQRQNGEKEEEKKEEKDRPKESGKKQEKPEKPETEMKETEKAQPESSHEESVKERATPVAGRMAKEAGIDLADVEGTGPGGKRTKEDVEKYLSETGQESEDEQANESPTAKKEEREERVPMSRRRLTIAKRLVEAQQNAAILTTFNEIDMSAVMNMRKRHKELFKERYGVGLGILSFFVKASVVALREFPRLNAEVRDNEMILKQHFDIGIAIGASEGLVVPVLRDSDKLRFHEIETQIKEFSERADKGKLSLDDLRGGSFTITNGGVFGSLLSTPILNPPQVGILGLHKIEDRPIAVNEEIQIRPMMYVALSYDHRIVDGREAVQFLVRIKSLVEDEGALLLES